MKYQYQYETDKDEPLLSPNCIDGLELLANTARKALGLIILQPRPAQLGT
jgi:hypothetical protein